MTLPSLRARLLPLTALLLVVIFATCTDAPLVRNIEIVTPVFDNKLALSGEMCTSDPDDLVFPLKVLFIVDTSQSMNYNDPLDQAQMDTTQATGRSRAMRSVITRFIDLGVKFTTPTGAPAYCNTGEAGCEQGSTTCATCNTAYAPLPAMCVGPDCCTSPPCAGAPVCPPPTETNGTCIPMCDETKAGCMPGEKGCPDCPSANDRCMNGICAKTLDPGVEFALIRFGAAKEVVTRTPDGEEGFTKDPRELVSALPRVNFGFSVTDYEGALSSAFKLLSNDMARMRKDNASAVNRSKYVVIFVSDGQPDPQINDQDDWDSIPEDLQRDLLAGSGLDPSAVADYNVSTRVLRRVQEIIALKAIYRVAEIKLHTAYIAGQNPAWAQDSAVALLSQMAKVGKGTFRNFQNGEELNFLHVDFSSLRRVFRLKSFIVTNTNGRPEFGQTVTDSDADSLDDKQEKRAGTNVAMLDTDGDGFSDTLEHFFRTSGWDPLDPADADCPLAAADLDGDGRPDDSDGDGLLDCEERFLGTSKDLFDTDADGVPDGIEIRFGMNPGNPQDVNDDLDFDGMPDGDEIRLHTDPRADDAAHRSRASYRYDVVRVGTGIEPVGVHCSEDADCPSGAGCSDNWCRCTTDDECSSRSSCTTDDECTRPDEICSANQCVSEMTCQQVDKLGKNARSCAVDKHITCYKYKVENIALVTPLPGPTDLEEGWNNVYLFFGEVPFDNPGDYGNFQVACVRARYLDSGPNAGAKKPANGALSVPLWAWKAPKDLNPATDCVCPDGVIGTCPAP